MTNCFGSRIFRIGRACLLLWKGWKGKTTRSLWRKNMVMPILPIGAFLANRNINPWHTPSLESEIKKNKSILPWSIQIRWPIASCKSSRGKISIWRKSKSKETICGGTIRKVLLTTPTRRTTIRRYYLYLFWGKANTSNTRTWKNRLRSI